MNANVIGRAAAALGAGALIAGAWAGPAAAQGTPGTTDVRPAASGTKWCGFNYDHCVQERNAFRHYGHHVGEIYNAGIGNTCPPESSCNGYYFTWWT